jgi:hypothetical protein
VRTLLGVLFAPFGWMLAGALWAFTWAGRVAMFLYEADAFASLFERAWCLVFRARPLLPEEIAASREVHPPGFIPYDRIRVDEGSLLTRINGGRAVSTMHVIHYPKDGVSLSIAVHELSHVVQYEHVGARIMAEALHAQYMGSGYDYGDLVAARQRGKRFRDFNREQQAQICQDYYSASHNLPTRFGGTLAGLRPFVEDMQHGEI